MIEYTYRKFKVRIIFFDVYNCTHYVVFIYFDILSLNVYEHRRKKKNNNKNGGEKCTHEANTFSSETKNEEKNHINTSVEVTFLIKVYMQN